MAASPPDVDIGYKLAIATIVTFVGAFVVISLRSVARLRYATLGWDDYCMLFALAQDIVATAFDLVALDYGLGRHTVYLNERQISSTWYWHNLSQVFCTNAMTFAKISICLSYLRILKGSNRPVFRVICILTGVLNFVVNTVVIFSFYVRCIPPRKTWDPFVPGNCWPMKVELSLALLQGAFSALTDYSLSIMPIFLLKDLQISRNNKILLCGLMGLGAITGIFATVRTVEIAQGLSSSGPDDSTYSEIPGLTWAAMERNIAMLTASVPSLRPLAEPFVRITSKTFSSWRSSGGRTQDSYEMYSSTSTYQDDRPKLPAKDLASIKKEAVVYNERSSSLEHILQPAPTASSRT